jgi:hypothetical protein
LQCSHEWGADSSRREQGSSIRASAEILYKKENIAVDEARVESGRRTAVPSKTSNCVARSAYPGDTAPASETPRQAIRIVSSGHARTLADSRPR